MYVDVYVCVYVCLCVCEARNICSLHVCMWVPGEYVWVPGSCLWRGHEGVNKENEDVLLFFDVSQLQIQGSQKNA